MAGPAFGAHICDLEVDKETGRSKVVRYTAIQDVGKAVHPSFVEGQMQGGAAQGIGWALNEEYVYNADGRDGERRLPRLPHAGRLGSADDRHRHRRGANPLHPYGVRGVGEVPIVPPLAAVANAMRDATGIRFTELPLSPPRVLRHRAHRAAVDLIMPTVHLPSDLPRLHRRRRHGRDRRAAHSRVEAVARPALSRTRRAARRHGRRHRRRDLRGSDYQPLRADSEVHLVPRISGG